MRMRSGIQTYTHIKEHIFIKEEKLEITSDSLKNQKNYVIVHFK